MADIEYTVDADTKSAISNINDVESATDKMVSGFNSADKSIKKTGDNLDKLGSKGAKLTKSAKGVNDALGEMGGRVGQASVQLQQFIGQIQGGQNALVALSAQAADLGFVLGTPLVGALVGIGAAIAGIAINALSSAGAVDAFIESLKELSDEELSDLGGQKQATAIDSLNKSIDGYTRNIEKNQKEIDTLRAKEAALIKQRDEAREQGFAGAVETARIQSTQKSIEALTIANEDLTKSREKDTEKLKILNDELNINQESIDDQIKSAEGVAAVIGKNAVEIAKYNKEISINRLEQEGATQAEIDRASAAYDAVIAFAQKTEADKNSAAAAKDAAKADRDAALAQRERMAAVNALSQIDPAIGVGFEAESQYKNLEAAREADLINEEQYQRRKTEITRNAEQQIMQIAEERYAAQSASNEFLINSLNALESSAASAFSSFVVGASSATELVQSLAMTILNQAIGALVQLGIQQVKNQVIGETAQAASATSAALTGAAIASSYAPAASFVSLASYGANAAPAAAGIASTTALAQSLAIPAFEQGGTFGGGIMRMGEGNSPEVMSTSAGLFAVPGDRGRMFNQEQLSQIGGGEVKVTNVVNNYASSATVDTRATQQQDGSVIIETIVADIRTGNGPVSGAMNQAYPALTRKTK